MPNYRDTIIFQYPQHKKILGSLRVNNLLPKYTWQRQADIKESVGPN